LDEGLIYIQITHELTMDILYTDVFEFEVEF